MIHRTRHQAIFSSAGHENSLSDIYNPPTTHCRILLLIIHQTRQESAEQITLQNLSAVKFVLVSICVNWSLFGSLLGDMWCFFSWVRVKCSHRPVQIYITSSLMLWALCHRHRNFVLYCWLEWCFNHINWKICNVWNSKFSLMLFDATSSCSFDFWAEFPRRIFVIC